MNIKVTRAKLESLVEDLVNRSIELKVAPAGCRSVRFRYQRRDPRWWSDSYADGAEESGRVLW